MRYFLLLLLVFLFSACGTGPEDKIDAIGKELCDCVERVAKTQEGSFADCRTEVFSKMDTTGVREAVTKDPSLNLRWVKAMACLEKYQGLGR